MTARWQIKHPAGSGGTRQAGKPAATDEARSVLASVLFDSIPLRLHPQICGILFSTNKSKSHRLTAVVLGVLLSRRRVDGVRLRHKTRRRDASAPRPARPIPSPARLDSSRFWSAGLRPGGHIHALPRSAAVSRLSGTSRSSFAKPAGSNTPDASRAFHRAAAGALHTAALQSCCIRGQSRCAPARFKFAGCRLSAPLHNRIHL